MEWKKRTWRKWKLRKVLKRFDYDKEIE